MGRQQVKTVNLGQSKLRVFWIEKLTGAWALYHRGIPGNGVVPTYLRRDGYFRTKKLAIQRFELLRGLDEQLSGKE